MRVVWPLLLLAVHAHADCPPPDAESATSRIGVHLATGVGVADARTVDVSLDLSGAKRVAPRLFAVVRLGWSRRTHVGDDVDSADVAAGVTVQLAAMSFAVLELGAATRGELRWQARFITRDVARAGIGGQLSLGLALHDVPLVIGVRAQQGLTPLVDDVRARSLLLDIAIDMRGGVPCDDTLTVVCR